MSMCKISLTKPSAARSTIPWLQFVGSGEIMLVTNPKGDQAAPPLLTEIMEVMHTMQQYMQHSETHLQKVEATGKEIGVT
jgi:hypothetical protein